MAPLLAGRMRQQGLLRSQGPATTCLHTPVRNGKLQQPSRPVLGKARSRCSMPPPQAALRASPLGSRSSSWQGPSPARWVPSAPPRRGPYIHGAVMRRGGRIIISAVLAGVESATDVRSLLGAQLDGDSRLVVGQLDNGLRYVVYPNKLPPHRFEAHLEMHVGSVDELANEQGMAHLVEHVTFLGSAKREALLGTGARANAYTDFHHTVFHVHAPVVSQTSNQPMLPQVLEALKDIAFLPQFTPVRIEKERKAVQAEAQMMNTIEYRVDCQLLQHLHYENNLGCRFPIGKMDQVQKWSQAQLKEFWTRWYFPANATLYVVGDLDRGEDEILTLIKQVFGSVPPGKTNQDEVKRLAQLSAAAADGHQPPSYTTITLPPSAINGTNGSAASTATSNGAATSNGHHAGSETTMNGNGNGLPVLPVLLKERHAVRPPVSHQWGVGPLDPGFKPAGVNLFRHPLLQNYMLSVFCKLPITPMSRLEHLKRMFMLRMLVSTFQFRVSKRYVAANPPFLGISLDISDSGREGCVVCTLTVTSEPRYWKGATEVAVQEMRRLQRHGLTQGELDRYTAALIRDSEQLAEQGDRIPSLDTLNFVMESLACGHTVMKHKAAHEAMVAAAETTTLEDINSLARSMLTFGSDYGHEAEALARAAEHPEQYTAEGPNRCTSILVCIPAYVSDTGESISMGGGATAARAAANLGAAGHIDVDAVDLKAIEEQSKAAALLEEMVPEGAVRFEIPPEEVQAVLADSYDVEAPVDVPCPAHLLPPEELQRKLDLVKPRYVALDGSESGDPFPPADSYNGVVQRRLSNGMRLNYRHTDNEPKGALLRVIAPGGKASEKMHIGPDGFGAVALGPTTLNESGRVGGWQREEVEVFSITHLINMMMDCDEENILLDMHFAVGQGSMEAAFEAMHMMLEAPMWSEEAFKRAKTQFRNQRTANGKSLEKASEERMMDVMMGGRDTRRFRLPTEEELEALTLEGVKQTMEGLLHPEAIEINIVGDIDGPALEAAVLKYLGSIPPRNPATIIKPEHITQAYTNPSFEERHFAWHLHDSDERGTAYISGPCPARWGPMGNFDPLPPLTAPIVPPPPPVSTYPTAAARQQAAELRRQHPLYTSCLLMLLTEIINSRLFTTVRDSLGLTYDVSFSVTMMDRVRAGWFSVHVTSDPGKIYDALDASVAVLRDIQVSPINRRELARARTTILTRHESDLKDNSYWLGLITHLQNPTVPWKTIDCLRDLIAMYESMTVEDVFYLYQQLKLDDAMLYTCVGTSGKEPPAPPEARLRNGIGSTYYEEQKSAQQQHMAPMNPMALFTAMMAAAQSVNLKKALEVASISKPSQQQQQAQQRQQGVVRPQQQPQQPQAHGPQAPQQGTGPVGQPQAQPKAGTVTQESAHARSNHGSSNGSQ